MYDARQGRRRPAFAQFLGLLAIAPATALVTFWRVVSGGPSLTDSARVQMNVVRAGVNYRL